MRNRLSLPGGRRWFAALALACVGMVAVLFDGRSVSAAQYRRMPVKLRMAVLFKALSYDNNLKTRCPLGIRLGVVNLAGDREGAAVGKEVVSEVRSNTGTKVRGLAIWVKSVAVSSLKDLGTAVEKNKFNTLYLCPGMEKLVASLGAWANQQRILVLTGEYPHVEAAAALGVVLRGRRPKILINLVAAHAQGADFGARLLQAAKIVK